MATFPEKEMIRIICCENEHTAMMHVGGPPDIKYRSFDIDFPELEAWLDEHKGEKGHSYNQRTITGMERLSG
jgi:hypothetical protein